jgi:hypothetical protein
MISYFSKTQLYFSSKKKKIRYIESVGGQLPPMAPGVAAPPLGFVVGGWPPIGGGRQPIDSARL